jgi:hypothetical protein
LGILVDCRTRICICQRHGNPILRSATRRSQAPIFVSIPPKYVSACRALPRRGTMAIANNHPSATGIRSRTGHRVSASSITIPSNRITASPLAAHADLYTPSKRRPFPKDEDNHSYCDVRASDVKAGNDRPESRSSIRTGKTTTPSAMCSRRRAKAMPRPIQKIALNHEKFGSTRCPRADPRHSRFPKDHARDDRGRARAASRQNSGR